MSHVLQHQRQFAHRLSCLVKDLPSCSVVHVELVNPLLTSVDFSLTLFQLLVGVLGFQLRCSSLVVHDVNRLLLVLDLAIDVFDLTAKPLRDLLFLRESPLQVFVLHHLIRSVAAQV